MCQYGPSPKTDTSPSLMESADMYSDKKYLLSEGHWKNDRKLKCDPSDLNDYLWPRDGVPKMVQTKEMIPTKCHRYHPKTNIKEHKWESNMISNTFADGQQQPFYFTQNTSKEHSQKTRIVRFQILIFYLKGTPPPGSLLFEARIRKK